VRLSICSQYDEAIAAFKKNIELNPEWYGDYEYLFHAYVAKQMYVEAVSAYIHDFGEARASRGDNRYAG
jgi:hypothetical protein